MTILRSLVSRLPALYIVTGYDLNGISVCSETLASKYAAKEKRNAWKHSGVISEITIEERKGDQLSLLSTWVRG